MMRATTVRKTTPNPLKTKTSDCESIWLRPLRIVVVGGVNEQREQTASESDSGGSAEGQVPSDSELSGMMRFSACYVAEYLAESGESESPDVGDDWSDSDSGSKLWNAAIVEFLLLRDFR